MSELVTELAGSHHPVVAERYDSAQSLQKQIEQQFVLLKFTNTQGGTELGCQLDMNLTQLNEADFDNAIGKVQLVGELNLDYKTVQMRAEIDLATLEGRGGLTLL